MMNIVSAATATTAAGGLRGNMLAFSMPHIAIQLKKELDEQTRLVMAPKLPPKKAYRMPSNIFDTSILYDEYEDGFLREGPARLLGMTPAPDGSWIREPLDADEGDAHNIAAERDTVSTRPDAVATTTTSDDNNAAVVASAVELPRQDVCPAPDSWWYVVLSTAKCYTGERDDRSLLTDSDHEPAASSQPPLAEDEVETGTSSELPLAVGDMEVVSSSQLLSGDGEEGSAPLSRPTSSLSLVEGGTPSGGSERERILVHGEGTRHVSPTHDDLSFLGPVGVSCVWVDARWLQTKTTYEDDTAQQGLQKSLPHESTTVTFCISVHRGGGFHVVSPAWTAPHSTASLTSEHLPPDDSGDVMGAFDTAGLGVSRGLAVATSSQWGAILVPAILAGESGVQISTPCDKESALVDSDCDEAEDDDTEDDENFCFYSLCYWLTSDDICCFYSFCYRLNTAFIFVMTASVLVKRLMVGAVIVLLCALRWASVFPDDPLDIMGLALISNLIWCCSAMLWIHYC